MLEIVYLAHSGFALLTDNATVIIDYYSDSCAGSRCLAHGVVDEDALSRPGRLYILSSHAHADHFNPVVLRWKQRRPDAVYLFSQDILDAGLAASNDAVYLQKGHTYADETLQVRAFGSTDAGVSFVLKLAGHTVLHAGDLNNWHWNQEVPAAEAAAYEQAYLAELATLAAAYPHLDAALFPVDPRLGRDYMRGAEQLVEAIDVDCFVPMHFWEDTQKANAFAPLARKRFAPITRRGETIRLS